MMSCLCLNQWTKYVVLQIGMFILIGIIQFIQAEYTLDLLNPKDRYTADVIRSKLTRDIAGTFQEVRDELVVAMDDMIPAREHGTQQIPTQKGYTIPHKSQHSEWVKIPLKETVQRVICRITNRIIVGAPLCS